MSNRYRDNTSWRARWHDIIFEADTPAGRNFDIVLLVAILGSLAAIMLESVQSISEEYRTTFRYLEWFFAVPWAGGVFVPVNTRLAAPEVAYWLADSGSRVLFVDDAFVPMLRDLKGKMDSVEKLVQQHGMTSELASDHRASLAVVR